MKITEEHWEEFGLNRTLSVLDLPKNTWYYWKDEKVDWEQRYEEPRDRIEEIIDDHSGYGRPRITPEYADRYGEVINHKVVGKILRMNWDLRLKQNARKTGNSAVEEVIDEAGEDVNLVKKRVNQDRPIAPFEIAYTDFTEIVYANGTKKAKMMPVIDHTSKLVLGWSIAKERDHKMALRAWEDVKETLTEFETGPKGMIIHHDQDSVYRSGEWISQVFLKDGAQISFTLRGAKDNPYIESFNGHFKKPNESLFGEAKTLEELVEIIADRVDYWNEDRRHSSLGQISPMEFMQQEGENGKV